MKICFQAEVGETTKYLILENFRLYSIQADLYMYVCTHSNAHSEVLPVDTIFALIFFIHLFSYSKAAAWTLRVYFFKAVCILSPSLVEGGGTSDVKKC